MFGDCFNMKKREKMNKNAFITTKAKNGIIIIFIENESAAYSCVNRRIKQISMNRYFFRTSSPKNLPVYYSYTI